MDKMIISFFGGLEFLVFNAHPRCRALLDTRFDFYALNFGKSGTMDWGIGEDEPKPAPFPALFWTVPGVRYRYGAPRGRHWDHAYVTFRGPRVDRWIREGLLPEAKTGGLRRVGPPVEAGERMARLQQVLGDTSPDPGEAVWLLEGLLLDLHRSPLADKASVVGKVTAVRDDLRADPVPDRDWDAVAARCGLSPIHFRRLFRQLFGSPPHRFLLDARLHRGARLLRQGAALERAAETCGFPDPYYFSRMFSRHFGMPPVRYRKRHDLAAG